MAITKEDLESFNRYVEEKMNNGGAELSLEECVLRWRQETARRTNTEGRSAFDVLSAAGFLGCVATGVGDVSTNPAHMEGFTKS